MKDPSALFNDIEELLDLLRMEDPILDELKKQTEQYELLQNFINDLKDLVAQIRKTYQNTHDREAKSDDIVSILTELIPEEELIKIKTVLSALSTTDWFPDKTLDFDSNALAQKIGNKVLVLHDPQKNLSTLRRNLRLSESKQEINQSTEVIEITKAIRTLCLKSSEQRVLIQTAALTHLMNSLPESISSFSLEEESCDERLDQIRIQLLSLTESKDSEDRAETENLLQVCQNSEKQLKVLHKQLLTAMQTHLNHLKPGLTQPTIVRLKLMLTELSSLSKALAQSEANIMAYSDKVEKYNEVYRNTLITIHEEYHSPAEVSLREREEIAILHFQSYIDPKNYYYKLSGQDLIKSENRYFKELRSAYHSEKIIIPTLVKTNLAQIQADADRGLQFNGLFYKKKELTRLERILKEEFGQVNTEKLIKHFNQNTSYLASYPLTTSLAKYGEILIQQRSDLDLNLYEKEGMVYREIKAKGFKVRVQKSEDPDEDELWDFKANIQVHAWLSDEGFKVDAISTDSPLVALAYMNESASSELMKIIHLVKNMEDDYQYKLDKLAEEEKSSNQLISFAANLGINIGINLGLGRLVDIEVDKKEKEYVLTNALVQIKLFRTGNITLDELIQGLSATQRTAQTLPHANPLFGLVNTYIATVNTKTYNLIADRLKPLIAYREELRKAALEYKHITTPKNEEEKKEEPPSQSG